MRRAPPGAERWTRGWIVAAAAALLAAAWWLRDPQIRYLAIGGIATLGALALAVPRAPGRRWTLAASAVLAMLVLVGALAQRELARIDGAWPAYRAGLVARGEGALAASLDETAAALRAAAVQALDAPAGEREAFAALAGLPPAGEGGVVLYRDTLPLAWSGRLHVAPRLDAPALALVRSPFYLALQARASRGGRTAVALALVQAAPPADSLTEALAEVAARGVGVRGFDLAQPSGDVEPDDARAWAPAGDTLLLVRALAPDQAEARVEMLRRARAAAGILLAIALVLLAAATWRGESGTLRRLVPLGVALACVARVPLNQLSTVGFLFDPAVYFATAGGPFTASIGALIVTGAIVLLGMLVVLRAHARARSRAPAAAVVVLAMLGGPFLLRLLSRGMSPPIEGITTGLWLAWEVGLFLAAASLLLGAATAGSIVLGQRRGLPPGVAPAIAAVVAAIAPLVLEAPARWPEWYAALWVVAIGAVALTRRHRWLLLSAAAVAALGATTLAWRADVGARVALATGDIDGLVQARPEVETLLARLGAGMADGPPPASEAALLRAYAASDLEGSGLPVSLATWGAGDSLAAAVPLAPLSPDEAALAALRREARAEEAPLVRLVPGAVGVFHALAVPFPDGEVATVLVAPRTRIVRDDPGNALLGVAPRETGNVPYTLSLAPERVAATEGARWHREGDELHGHRVIGTRRGLARVEIRIELRPFDVLLQRGALVLMLDLVIMLALWALSASPERAFWRWARARTRQWGRSYRLRLTLALFAFFVVPAAAFAAWSGRQLREGDLQGRELLVREALRAVDAADTTVGAAPATDAPVPVLAYRAGELAASSEPLVALLAPIGRFVPPEIHERLALGNEVELSRLERVGDERWLFGYRAAAGEGARLVLAAPAPASDEALGRRRRDLGVLVLLATVLGALAALWLSGVAARTLAEPIGGLSGAALALAEGESEPPLPPRPPAEFVPVFDAFRRMARDVRESAAALEAAERRTRAVLRNVASGVVAVDGEGSVVLANPHAEELLGRALEPRAPLAPALPPELAARLASFLAGAQEEEEFDAVLEGRQLHARLTRLTSAGGSAGGGGAGGGAVLTLDDVTEMARAQRVLAWGEMARQVAHEIKNPLTPIRLGVQHLRRARADERPDFDQILDRNVTRILAEIDRLDQIARGFSRYGMAPAEREPPQPVDIAAVARDVVELERLGRDEVRWSVAGADAPRRALAREDELREVLLNVLENARLAGATAVRVRLDGGDRRATIEVEDDGHGIPAHLLGRIFEPHFSTRTSGSGLGLAISRQLIEGWGGEISIESAEGKGTTVRIALAVA